jgi:hypothetical protein
MRGFPAGNFPFFAQDNIRPAQLCQMIGNIHSNDPPSHNDEARLIFHRSFLPFYK